MTITISATSAKANARAYLDEMPGCAVAALPYWPIWAAAQFASDDAAKMLLNFVHIFKDGDSFQIESTDGHRAFRYRFDARGADNLYCLPEDGLLLHAAPLKKAINYSKVLTVTDDLRLFFHGGKRQELTELSSYKLPGFYGVDSARDAKFHTFPNINQLWPKELGNLMGKPWVFNIRYLKEWLGVADKLAVNDNFKSQGGCLPITPFVLSCDYLDELTDQDGAILEYLLMPVQVRV